MHRANKWVVALTIVFTACWVWRFCFWIPLFTTSEPALCYVYGPNSWDMDMQKCWACFALNTILVFFGYSLTDQALLLNWLWAAEADLTLLVALIMSEAKIISKSKKQSLKMCRIKTKVLDLAHFASFFLWVTAAILPFFTSFQANMHRIRL